jgi:Trk-type K+ transport system membrane component
MSKRTSSLGLILGSVICLACGNHDTQASNAGSSAGSSQSPAATSSAATTQSSYGAVDSSAMTPAKHHSKLKGAMLGGVAGAMIGGKKGALLGAAAGAEAQHVKNKNQTH